MQHKQQQNNNILHIQQFFFNEWKTILLMDHLKITFILFELIKEDLYTLRVFKSSIIKFIDAF